MHKFDIICISKSYLNSDTLSSDDTLNTHGYNVSRARYPSGNRRGGVCIYYKKSLPIKMLNINYIQECICFDLKMGSKHCTIVSLYRSPSQSADEFENFYKQIKSDYGINYAKESICNPFNLKIFVLPRMKDIFGIINMQMLI